MTADFLLFRLPFLAIEKVIKSMDTYQLFGLSVQSNRSSRIVKIAVSKQKFKLDLTLNCPEGAHLLQVENEHLGLLEIAVLSSDEWESPPDMLKFPGNSDVVPAIFRLSGSSPVICSYWEDCNTGAHSLLRYMCIIFSIDSIKIIHLARDKKLANATNAILKELNLRISRYIDKKNDYTFKQVESIFSATIGGMSINYPRMKFEEFIILFKKWMGGNSTIMMNKPPGIMNLEPLIELFDERPEIISNDNSSAFEFKRNDGKDSLVTSNKKNVIFQHDYNRLLNDNAL